MERKEKDIKCQHTSVKNGWEKTDTRRRSNFSCMAGTFLGKILVMFLLNLSIKQFLFSERFNS